MTKQVTIGFDHSHNNKLTIENSAFTDFIQYLFNSDFKLGKIDIETKKAFLALIDGFVDTPIWIPKSVVDPSTKRIIQWFIDQKNKELKDFQRTKKQAGLEDFL